MYGFGIVGCGVIGSRLAAAVAAHDRFELEVVCDLDGDRAAALATEYDARATTDHAELLADGAVDVVHVGVPPLAHREVVGDALAADRHVVCEKPIAESAAVGRELVGLARDADRVTAVNLPFRYTPGFVELRERVASGAIGDPRRVELRFRFPRWPREWQDVDWLAGREQGGPLREVGTHFLFGVQELFGPIDRVGAEIDFSGPDTYEDDVVGWFAAGGVRGTIDLLCDHDGPERNLITVVGDDASLSLTDWYRLVRDRGRPDERTLVDERGDTTARLLAEVAAAIDGDDADLVSFAEATRVQAVVDALLAGGGEPIAVEPGV